MDLLALGSRQTSMSSALGEVRAVTCRWVKVVIAGSSISSTVGLGTSLTMKLLVVALKVVFSSFYASFYARAVYYSTLASKLARLVG